jgi:hypothetical protein
VQAVSGVPEAETFSSAEAALEIVDAVAAEAGQLKVALGGSLPLSYSVDTESATSENESGKEREQDAHEAVDTATAAGIEMAELLIATSELQRAILQKRLGRDGSRNEGLLA